MIKPIITLFLIVFSSFSFCNIGFAADRVPVFVSIVPQKFFVEQIGKDQVDVRVMVQPGSSPATYEPKPKQMARISKTKIYFAIGVPFESAWLKKIATTNPNMKIIHTDQGIDKIPVSSHHHDHEDKHHGKGEHHDDHSDSDYGKDEHHDKDEHHGEHGTLDPHIWLSPPLVKIQAKTILDTLKNADPSHGKEYEANYNKFVSEIDRLDTELKKTFADKQGLQFMVFHPSWGYFAQTYGLEQIPVEIEGKNPKPSQLEQLIEHAKEKGIRVVFVQPQFSAKSAKLVANEIGGQIVTADPLAENWFANLRKVADKFKKALK